MGCGNRFDTRPILAVMRDAQEKRDEAYLRKHSNVDDPLNPKVKHIVHHNSPNDVSEKTNTLQKKINKAISKIMDMNLLESDKKELVKILTE